MKNQKRKERRRHSDRRKFLDLIYFSTGGKERRSGRDRRYILLPNIRYILLSDIREING